MYPDTFTIGPATSDLTSLFFGDISLCRVFLYEDNAGGLHLWQEDRRRVVTISPAGGDFAQDAQALAAGNVVEWNGQTAYLYVELQAALRDPINGPVLIAEYDPATGNVQTYPASAGTAGRDYLRLERPQ